MSKRFRVSIAYYWPDYWKNFLEHCNKIAKVNNWNILTVINHELKPHGRFVQTNTQGAYLRWDDEKYHTMFLLRWA